MTGYIKLHRQIMENEFYFSEKFTKTQAWFDLLLLANHKPATVFIRGIEIHLSEGELCRSQISLADRWKWNFKTVKKFLDLLVERNMIKYRGDKITTIITIVNWQKYQKNGEQNYQVKSVSKHSYSTDNGDQNEEQKENKMETDNNVKNEKKNTCRWFEEFWKEYPRKVSKKAAKGKFLSLCKDEETFREILAGLQLQKSCEQWNKENGKYIPHPATWLNQERWKDELKTTNNSNNFLKIGDTYAEEENAN